MEPFLCGLPLGAGYYTLSVRPKLKVYVKLYANLVERIPEELLSSHKGEIKAGVPFEAELAEKSSVADLLSFLNLQKKEAVLVFINGRNRRIGHILAAGDEIGIFPPIGGG
jgi:sulfur carrier protein ThiS